MRWFPSPSPDFFFNDTAPTEIYTLSLHDALPICWPSRGAGPPRGGRVPPNSAGCRGDRKSTRLNSSHANISYAVCCLKKQQLHDRLAYSYTRLKHYGMPILISLII